MSEFIPYTHSAEEVMDHWQTSPNGLSSDEVENRIETYGRNELTQQTRVHLAVLFFHQFKNSIVLLLFIAAVVSILFRDYTEAMAILAVIIINAIIGFIIEAQAVSSMEALRKLDKIYAIIVRDGQPVEVEAWQLVPGDILILETGNNLPADARLIESTSLEVNESTLTGESVPILKSHDTILDVDTVLADRVNMVYKGTSVTRGNAKSVIVSTGQNTEVGRISDMVEQAQKEEIPLNRKLNTFSRKLIWLTVMIIVPFFIIGWVRSHEAHLMIETAIALAVAAIPEGLPIVATISLARGMMRLSGAKVIVKKLAAVETLGETDLIITDKTGTLTENHLKVEVTELTGNEHTDAVFSEVAVLCNNAVINEKGEEIGDPVETALLRYVSGKGHHIAETRSQWKEVDEKPFDSSNRYMANLYKSKNDYLVTAKGSPAELLELCTSMETENGQESLSDASKEYWQNRTKELSAEGLKVLGFAYRRMHESTDEYAQELTFLGLVGFQDPPRADVRESIQACHEAGIRVIMATGDHPETGKAIANQIGLIRDHDSANVFHGRDLFIGNDSMLGETQVFSRVTPEQKLKLISYFQKEGHVVAMTGDGVNDAPALKKADIGIAMGLHGTQVAEEASDMVLQDDSFSSIVKAIKQGRIIFRNIRNFIIYLLSCNLTEIMVVAIAAFSSASIPLLPLQILFLNIVTDVFPALALGMGEGNPSIMKDKSRSANEPVITTKNWISIVVYSVILTASILGLYFFSTFYLKNDAATSNTIAFYTLAFAQLWHPFNLIGRKDHLLRNDIVGNLHLWVAILFCIALLLMTYIVPFLKDILQITDLNGESWFYVAVASLAPLLAVRATKMMKIIA